MKLETVEKIVSRLESGCYTKADDEALRPALPLLAELWRAAREFRGSPGWSRIPGAEPLAVELVLDKLEALPPLFQVDIGQRYVVYRAGVSESAPRGTGWVLTPEAAFVLNGTPAESVIQITGGVVLEDVVFSVDLDQRKRGIEEGAYRVSSWACGYLLFAGDNPPCPFGLPQVHYSPRSGPPAFVNLDSGEQVARAYRARFTADGLCFIQGAR